MSDLYVEGLGTAEPTGASGVVPDSYWMQQWLAADTTRTVAQWRAMRERERVEYEKRQAAERRAIYAAFRARVPAMAEWTDEQIQEVRDAVVDEFGLDY